MYPCVCVSSVPPNCALLGRFSTRFCCYDNIARTRNVSEYMLVVLAVCLVEFVGQYQWSHCLERFLSTTTCVVIAIFRINLGFTPFLLCLFWERIFGDNPLP